MTRDQAELDGHEVMGIAERDADVPLTDLGRAQALRVGVWLADNVLDVVVCSSYRRAQDTAAVALAEAARRGATAPIGPIVDERLRDRELGVLDLLTSHGLLARFPDEVDRRRHLGKFYHRPPGGESWADVVLRVRFLLSELHDRYAGRRVALFAHDMTIHALSYILEGVAEPELLRRAARTSIANGAIAVWEPDDGAVPFGYRMVFSERIAYPHTARAAVAPEDDTATRAG